MSSTSHLVHVPELPSDALAVSKYGAHSFSNLFYSPSNGKLYQKYPRRIREIETANIEHGKGRKVYVRNSEGHTVYVSMKKLLQSISELPNDKENPITIKNENGEEPIIDDPADECQSSEVEEEKPKETVVRLSDAVKPRRKGKPIDKINFVEGAPGQKTRSQVGGIVNAQTALQEATATKHRRYKKKKITIDDIKL